MPGSETIKLDPAAVATARTEVDITQYVAIDGVEWGDAAIEQYLAERGGYGGAIPVDYRVPNRTITMPLKLETKGTVTFDTIRRNLQAKTALLQAEGGWLGRVTSNGGTVFADVTNATLKLGGGWGQARGRYDEEAELTLECLPDWYGPEVSASSTHTETSLPWLIWTETGIDGDYPGRCRLVVNEADADDQLGVVWGFRSRHYSSASTAALAYEAEALTPVSPAALASLSGASGGGSNTIQLSSAATTWTTMMNTNLAAGTYLTHTGSYRAWARVYSTSGTTVQMRLVWDVGDLANPTENAAWRFPGASNFYMADLGEVRLDQIPVGSHRWQGQVQAKGDAGGESCRVDALMFQPLDESAGKLRAVPATTEGTDTNVGQDAFNQSAGALAGKAADVGGNWAGAGDADDFAVEATGHTAQRTAVSDTSAVGRYAISGASAFANGGAQVDFKSTLMSGVGSLSAYHGVLMRYVDTSNWLMARLLGNSGFAVVKKVAGVTTTLASGSPFTALASTWYTIKLTVTAAGVWNAWIVPQGSSFGSATLSGTDSALATGGALASGKPGFYNEHATATAGTRNYDNFAAWTPGAGSTSGDAVMFASQTLELRTEGAYREDPAGAAYGPVSEVTGDLPRVPVAGLEGRTTQVFVKASRGDLEDIADAGIDDINAQLNYRPCWLYLPEP